MLWIALISIIAGVLLNGKGKKDNDSTMKTIGIVLLVVGILVLVVTLVGMVWFGFSYGRMLQDAFKLTY